MKKFLLLSLAALGLLASSPQASAATINDFGSPNVGIVTFFSWTNSSSVPWLSEGNFTFAPTTASDGSRYLRIDNLLGTYVFDKNIGDFLGITIDSRNNVKFNNTQTAPVRFSSNGQTQYLPVINTAITSETSGRNTYNYVYVLIPHDGSYYLDELTTSLTQTLDGYRIQTGPFDVAKMRIVGTLTNVSYYLVEEQYEFGGLSLEVFSPNATITDSEYALNESMRETFYGNRTYKARVTTEGNEIKITNFSNVGRPYSISQANNGTFQYAIENYEGTINESDLTIEFKNNPSPFYAVMSDGSYNYLYTMYFSKDFNTSTSTATKITGKIDLNSVKHIGTNKWVGQNANKTVLTKIIFDDYISFYLSSSDIKPFIPNSRVKNTVITLDEGIEYTHQVYINRKEFGYGTITTGNSDKYIYVNCELYNKKNTVFVKDYELYIMPTIDNPNYNSADFNDENGHVNATRIDLLEYAHDFIPSESDRRVRKLATDEGEEVNPLEGYKYNLLIPENDLKAKDASGNGKYSLYVKTIYTDESGLEPTFQALTTLGDTTTGVEDIIDNGESDEDAPVVYYNMNGVQMNGDNLTPGIYIKKQGKTTSKVVIR